MTPRRRPSTCSSPRSAPAPASTRSASCSSAASTPKAPKITLRTHFDPAAGLISKIDLELQLPAGFPDKYRDAVINAMNLCTVKKHLHQPPAFEITTVAA